MGISYLPIKLGFLYILDLFLFFIYGLLIIQNQILYRVSFLAYNNLISNYWIGTNSGAEFYVVMMSLIFAVIYLSLFWAFLDIFTVIKTSETLT